MSRAIDAKIITMIDDLSHAALIDVLSNPITEAEKPYLASAIKQMYEAGLTGRRRYSRSMGRRFG